MTEPAEPAPLRVVIHRGHVCENCGRASYATFCDRCDPPLARMDRQLRGDGW